MEALYQGALFRVQCLLLRERRAPAPQGHPIRPVTSALCHKKIRRPPASLHLVVSLAAATVECSLSFKEMDARYTLQANAVQGGKKKDSTVPL